MKIIWTFTLLMIPGTMTSGNSGNKVNMACTLDSNNTDNYLCKVQWSECTEVNQTIVLEVTATNLFQDPMKDLSLTIGLSVAAVLIINGLVSFTMIYCMRRKTQGPNSPSKMPKPGTGNSEAVPQTGLVYEEIANTRPHTDPDTGTKTVYAIAQIPRTPPDSTKTVYATSKLPTNPSD